jgi:membrane-associated protease RseP (regulator of RpoE activity)
MDATTTLILIIGFWFLFYGAVKTFKLEGEGLEVTPYYAVFKSTALNGLINRLAGWKPRFWRLFGNVGVVLGVVQAAFASYLLTINLYRFLFKPEAALPIQPIIAGVTISGESLPWFLIAAGVVILTHELSHGVQCVIEGIHVKSAMALYAVVTFGGAVEPDEEDLNRAPLMTQLRIFSSGSMINLVTAVLTFVVLVTVGTMLPDTLLTFLVWLVNISFNLAVMNMLPLGPLDGGLVWKAVTNTTRFGKPFQAAATYAVLLLIVGNIVLSLGKFGLVQL